MVLLALVIWGITATLSLSIWTVGTVAAVTWGIATAGIVVVAWRAGRLLTGRVKL